MDIAIKRRLSDLPAFADVPRDVLDALDEKSHVQTLTPGRAIGREGDTLHTVGFILSGMVKMQKVLIDGREQIIGLLIDGDMFGRLYEDALRFDYETVTETTICSVDAKVFDRLIDRSPELDRVVMVNLLGELDRSRDWLTILGNSKAIERVACLLLVIGTHYRDFDHVLSRVDGKTIIKVPLSRGDVAHLIGARSETVSRAVTRLVNAGVVSMKSANEFIINDLNGLVEFSGRSGTLNVAPLQDFQNSS